MATPDLTNVQGIIVHGYGRLSAARFVLLNIEDVTKVRHWLKTLTDAQSGEGCIRNSTRKPDAQERCVNIAFTFAGLRRLNLGADTLAQFSREFQEGMCGSEHRTRALNDNGESAPDRWAWGGPKNDEVHMLLMGYADAGAIDDWHSARSQRWSENGVREIEPPLASRRVPDRKEHFGFRDGIAQPRIEGFGIPDGTTPENIIRTGEFLLGYPNEYGQFTERPLIGAEADEHGLLPSDLSGTRNRDFGRDGSYLVFRHLSQDVKGFWDFMDRASGGVGRQDPQPMIALASKMVGRWPSGAPLVLTPDADDPTIEDPDAFNYDRDGRGLACPLGSHIRRTNPRGSMGTAIGSYLTKEGSLKIERRHRILRRGRAFGPPLVDSMSPREVLTTDESDEARGMYFLCVNASISRQFEFLQQAWINSRKFQGLYDDPDPIMGNCCSGREDTDPGNDFVVPRRPVRTRVRGIPQFVRVRGGAYFFLPSLGALRYLAHLE